MSTRTEYAVDRDLMLQERRRRDRAIYRLVAYLVLAAAATHGAAIYGGIRLERWQSERDRARMELEHKPVVAAKPAAQTLGCREVVRLCRDEYAKRRGL